MSVKEALLKYSEKAAKKAGPKRTNKKPEKQVVKDIMSFGRKFLKLDLTIVESKATYSPASGHFTGRPTSESVSDIIGNDANGIAVYIEAKARGKRHMLKPHQKAFLERKIKSNCFAIVCDSIEYLNSAYKRWSEISTPQNKIIFLLSLLPKKRV